MNSRYMEYSGAQKWRPAKWAAGAFLMLIGAVAGAATPMVVTVNPAPAQPGEQVLVRVSVSNDGATPAQGIRVSMEYPAGMSTLAESVVFGGLNAGASCATSGGSTTCIPGETLIWDIAQLDPGRRVELSFPATVASGTADGSSIDWEASLSLNGTFQNDATAALAVAANAVADLTIRQDHDFVATGDTVAYTVDYGNPELTDITGASLVVTMPNGMTPADSTGGLISGQTITWSLGTFLAGATAQQKFTAVVDAGAAVGTQFVAQADVSGTFNFQPTLTQVRGLSSVGASVPLAAALSLDATAAPAGGVVLAKVRVSNPTTQPILDSRVVLRTPAGLTAIAESVISGGLNSSSSCDEVSGSATCTVNEFLIWDISAVNPGQSVELSIPLEITANAGRLIEWDARINTSNGARAFKRQTIAVNSRAIAALSVQQDADPVAPGNSTEYVLRFGNPTASDITATTLTANLPKGTTFVSASDAGILNGDTVTWPLGTLLAGSIDERRLVVTVPPGAVQGSQIALESDLNGTANFQPMQRRAALTAMVGVGGPLVFSVDEVSTFTATGRDAMTTVRVSNPTFQPVLDSRVRLRTPGGFEQISESIVLGGLNSSISCDEVSGSATCTRNEFLIWDIAALNPGQSVELSVPTRLASGTAAGRIIPWEALLTQSNGAQAYETTSMAVDDQAVVDLGVTQSADPVPLNGTLDYEIHYGNRISSDVTGGQLTLALPSGVTFVSASAGGVLNGATVEWPVGTLLGDASVRETVRVTVNSDAGFGALLEAVAEFSGTTNFRSTTSRSELVAQVGTPGPLTMTVSANPAPASPGEQTLVEVRVTNPGALPVLASQVVLRTPGGLNAIAESTTLGGLNSASSCDEVSGSATCTRNEYLIFDLPEINPGQTEELSFPATVATNTSSGRVIPWDARLIQSNGVWTFESAIVDVNDLANASLALDQSSDPLVDGDAIFYSVRFGNPGALDIMDGVVTLRVPAGGVVVATSAGASVTGNVVTWTPGTVLAGSTHQRFVRFEPASGGVAGTQLPARAIFSGTSNFRSFERRVQDVSMQAVEGPLYLDLSVNPLPALPGEVPLVRASLTNTTGLPIVDASLFMRYPQRLNALTESTVTGGLNLGASCDQVSGSSTCTANEFLTWSIAQVAPGETLTFTFEPTIAGGTQLGQMIPFEFRLATPGGDTAFKRVTLPIGADMLGDTDGDMVGDSYDNCLLRPNTLQRDTDADGYGNACDADLTNDGIVNVVDLGLLRVRFFSADLDADLNGDGVVNVLDLGILRTLFFMPPGPSAYVP